MTLISRIVVLSFVALMSFIVRNALENVSAQQEDANRVFVVDNDNLEENDEWEEVDITSWEMNNNDNNIEALSAEDQNQERDVSRESWIVSSVDTEVELEEEDDSDTDQDEIVRISTPQSLPQTWVSLEMLE